MKLISVDIARNFGAIARINKEARINYDKYYKKACNGDKVHKCFAYGVSVDREADEFIGVLREIGYEVKYKTAKLVKNSEGNYEPKINLTSNNVQIIMDIVKNVDKVDTVVLGSNDKDLIPMIEWIRNKGVKVHILSLLIPAELKNAVDSYQELTNEIIEERQ